MLIKGAEKVAMDRAVDDEGNFTVWQEGLDFIENADVRAPDIVKGVERGSPGKVKGMCSTEHKDRQEETILQKGLDFGEFLAYGFFNDNHDQQTAAVVGVPLMVEYKPMEGWYTEGNLLDTDRAHRIAELSKALAKSKTGRKLGFSIEGKAVLRDKQSKAVLKARIRNIAITQCPVNPNCTWDLVTKALVFRGGDDLRKALPSLHKALSAGSGPGWSASANGSVLQPESLEKDDDDRVTHLYPCDFCASEGSEPVVFRSQRGLDRHIERSHTETGRQADLVTGKKIVRKSTMSEVEAIEYIRRMRPGYSDELIQQVINKAKILA